MALRQACNPFRKLVKIQKVTPVQKRSYAIEPTVDKIVLGPKNTIGQVPYLFTKEGQRLFKIQNEIQLRAYADAMVSSHAVVPNGGVAALVKLENAQKIASSPELLAQFKKNPELQNSALVKAIAWLKDIRFEKEAQEAAKKLDDSTKALLAREVAFTDIVPLKENLGLNLSLTQKATVADWYLSYAASSHLAATNSTYATLTGAPLSAEAEKSLASAAIERVTRALIVDSRNYIETQLDDLPSPVKYLTGKEFNAKAYAGTDSIMHLISAASRLIAEAAAIDVNQFTVNEIVHVLMQARNQLRAIVDTLKVEADARQTLAEEALLKASWEVLNGAKQSKAEVEKAAQFIQQNSHLASPQVVAWDELITKHLPTEAAALNEALAKLEKTIAALPQAAFQAEMAKRALDNPVDDPVMDFYDENYVRP